MNCDKTKNGDDDDPSKHTNQKLHKLKKTNSDCCEKLKREKEKREERRERDTHTQEDKNFYVILFHLSRYITFNISRRGYQTVHLFH